MSTCFYCEMGETLDHQMAHVCDLKYTRVYLVKNQNFDGRCIVVYKEHKTELFQLKSEELNGFSSEVAIVSKAIYELFGADKINYAIYGDGVPHLHCHLAPKKKGGYCWGSPFVLQGNDNFITEDEIAARVEMIKKYLMENPVL